MDNLYFLIAGTVLFFAPHLYSAFRSRERGRDTRENMGSGRFMLSYSLVAGLGFALMVWGYGLARPSDILYVPPVWGRTVTLAIMWPALILLMASYLPLGFIKKGVRHPMLIAVFLWSGAHLLANGEMNSVILFGSFFTYSIIGAISAYARPASVKKPGITGDILAVIIGSGLYFAFFQHLHELLIGLPIMV